MGKEPQRHEGLWQAVKAFSVLSGLGIYLVVVVGICLYIGMMVDEHLVTSPYGKLTGILLGFPVAIYTLYRRLKNL